MVYVMREGNDVHVEHETWTYGLFPTGTWLGLIEDAGLEAVSLPYPHSEFEVPHEFFAGRKPSSSPIQT